MLQKIEPKDEKEHVKEEKIDKDYKPHGIISRQSVKPPPDKHARRSKRFDNSDEKEDKTVEVCLYILSFSS